MPHEVGTITNNLRPPTSTASGGAAGRKLPPTLSTFNAFPDAVGPHEADNDFRSAAAPSSQFSTSEAKSRDFRRASTTSNSSITDPKLRSSPLAPVFNARSLSKDSAPQECSSPAAAKARHQDESDSEDDSPTGLLVGREFMLKAILVMSLVTGGASMAAVIASVVFSNHAPAAPLVAAPSQTPALRIPVTAISSPKPHGAGSVGPWTEVPVPGGSNTDGPLQAQQLTKADHYDLRAVKHGRLVGCAAPIGMFPGQPKYGCSGEFATAATCDAASNPIKDSDYVSAVHKGCDTAQGHGTYGYAYDDGNGLKQCAPQTKYEWILCPTGTEDTMNWEVSEGDLPDSPRRFRVTNKCEQTVWIQNQGMTHEKDIIRVESQQSYTYAIPNSGLPSTRLLPKVGCDDDGNACDVQSLPPCPAKGCDLPIDTKFEASWGCLYARGSAEDGAKCPHKSTYQDWWDGSAVDGWTLPFTVLVDDGGHGLSWNDKNGSPEICSPVVCARLSAAELCPQSEFLTPES